MWERTAASGSRLVEATSRTLTDFTGRTNWPHRAFLNRTQKFGLRFRAHLRDFVEEQRAALSGAKKARILSVRSAESAPPVAEEFAFDQVLGDRPAIERDEGRLIPGSRLVKSPRYQTSSRSFETSTPT
jgi:hypothetical protein